MRVAVLGLGSIGRRHATILNELGHEVFSYDPSAAAETPPGGLRAASEQAALREADAAIVASPPSEHLRQVRLALEARAHTLVEKPVAPSAEGVLAVGALARQQGLVLRAGMNLRFHPGVRTVRRLVEQGTIGRPLRASVWCGSWLPGWRSEVDYRQTYSAQQRLGGGVLLDAIHELDYAAWILGPVVRVRGLLAHTSALALDVEDVAALVLEHAGGTVTSLTLDYLDRAYHRGCRVIGDEGTVEWSWQREVVELHRPGHDPEHLPAASDVSPTYREQMKAFLEAVQRRNDDILSPATVPSAGEQTPGHSTDTTACTMQEAAAALAVADAARVASANTGTPVEVSWHEVALRPATAADADRLLRWRNDPTTRAASFSSEEVTESEHEAWLKRTLEDPDRHLLIAIEDGQPVGQLRLDRLEADDVEVHISLAPEARGHGLAVELLKLAAREHAPRLGAMRLRARVKPDNEASRLSFDRAGYRLSSERAEEWCFELNPEHSGVVV